MSGGHFEYNQFRLAEMAEEIQRIIESSTSFPADIIELFKETAHTLLQANEMVNRVDWLLCGDDSEESFRKRWKNEVCPYWNELKNEQ